MRPVVILPPVEAFGSSFPMPSQLRAIPWNLGRTSLTTRDPAAISQATQDYIDLQSGSAAPVTEYVETRTAFTTWKRNPWTSGATRPEYQGPAFSVPGYMQARGMTPATMALVVQGLRGLRGLGDLPPTQTMASHVDELGANRVYVKPPNERLSLTRLRPDVQRNDLPIDPMYPAQAAVAGSRRSEREQATAEILSGLNRTLASMMRRF